jgi:hypothetical protein
MFGSQKKKKRKIKKKKGIAPLNFLEIASARGGRLILQRG